MKHRLNQLARWIERSASSWQRQRRALCGPLALALLCLAAGFSGCKRGPKEAPITGKHTDAAVTMTATWQEGRRYIFRVDSTTSTQVPRKNTTQLIQTETSLAQDLAFTVTNVAPDGSRLLQMEILAVQMETGRDDGVTLSFDSMNQVMQVEDTPLIQRLRKLVGVKLEFRLSSENQVTRVDGVKDLNDRASSGSSAARGIAAQVINRCLNQQFYRDIVEMNFLPKTPVKIGESWTVDRSANVGPQAGNAAAHFTYTFLGWQARLGTNCARLDFKGEFKPPVVSTNDPPGRRGPKPPPSANIEEGAIIGRSWYSPELTLAVETAFTQSTTTKTSVGRRTRTVTVSSNSTEAVEVDTGTNAPSVNVVVTNSSGPDQPLSIVTITTHQATTIKLVEVEQLKQ